MNGDTQQMAAGMAAFLGIYLVFCLVLVAATILPLWFICKKAGFSPWLSFLVLIPGFGGFVLLYVLAFAEWKVIPAPHLAFQTPLPPPPPQQPPLPPQI